MTPSCVDNVNVELKPNSPRKLVQWKRAIYYIFIIRNTVWLKPFDLLLCIYNIYAQVYLCLIYAPSKMRRLSNCVMWINNYWVGHMHVFKFLCAEYANNLTKYYCNHFCNYKISNPFMFRSWHTVHFWVIPDNQITLISRFSKSPHGFYLHLTQLYNVCFFTNRKLISMFILSGLVKLLATASGSAFIKPDQRNPWIKDQLGNALLSTILYLQLPNFVSCGRACPSHMTQNLVTVGAKL